MEDRIARQIVLDKLLHHFCTGWFCECPEVWDNLTEEERLEALKYIEVCVIQKRAKKPVLKPENHNRK